MPAVDGYNPDMMLLFGIVLGFPAGYVIGRWQEARRRARAARIAKAI
jgi:hypothetical protein